MYDPKTIIDISNAFVKGYSSKYDKYLDERRTEWSNRVDENFRKQPVGDDRLNEDAKARLALFKEIVTKNEKYCRRDIEIPQLEYEDQFEKIAQYNSLRKEAGIEEPFPGVLAEEANLLMLKSDYENAFEKLAEAVEINNKYPELIVKRDIIRYMTEQVRCLYMLGKYDDANVKATEARRAASKISPDLELEKKEWEQHCAAPGLQFVPIVVHAYFSACDSIVHHPDWGEDEKLQKQFSGLWGDAVTYHNVPKSWRTPMKIAVVSDRVWVGRTESYMKEIAEQLYIELAPSTTAKVIRIVRAKWGGFNIDYPKSAAAAVALVAFLAASNVSQEYPRTDIIDTTVEYVMQNENGIAGLEKTELAESIDHYLPKDVPYNPEKILQSSKDAGDFDVPGNNHIDAVAYSSGSEGSVLRV